MKRLSTLCALLIAVPGIAMADPHPRAVYIGTALVIFAEMNGGGRAEAGERWIVPPPGGIPAGYALCPHADGSLDLLVWPEDAEGYALDWIAEGMESAATPYMKIVSESRDGLAVVSGCKIPPLRAGTPIIVSSSPRGGNIELQQLYQGGGQ